MLDQLFVNAVIAASFYSLIAIGFTIVYKTIRFFHFAHGVVYTVGAYSAYTLAITLGLNPITAFFLPPSLQYFSA